MKIGLIARMDLSGLGFQTRALYDLLKPAKTLVVDSTPFNKRGQHREWYKGCDFTWGFPNDQETLEFLKGLDVVITCEVPYNDKLYQNARILGVKTILQPNAELNPHFTAKHLDKPDYFFLPSSWYEEEYKRLGVPYAIVKPPIVKPRKQVSIAKVPGSLRVLYFGGRRAAFDRNGGDVVASLPDLEGVDITVHDQSVGEVEDQREIYERGYHIVLIPRRYGGLCLPMLESLSYGLPVIMPNIPPNSDELPPEWLTKATSPRRVMTKRPIDVWTPWYPDIVSHLAHWRNVDQVQYDQEREKAYSLYKDHQNQLKLWKSTIKQCLEGTK